MSQNLLRRLKFYDKEDRPWPALRLTSSAIVGHTTATGTRIWVRVHEPGNYCLVLAEDEIDTRQQPRRVRGRVALGDDGELACRNWKATLSYETDLTGVFDVDGLSPGTRYYYALFSLKQRAERWEVGRDEPLSFSTQPVEPDRLTFGLFSCHMPFKGRNVLNQHMWDSFHQLLHDLRADFVIGGGDQVYTDGDKHVSIWRWLRKVKKDVARLNKDDQYDVMTSWYRDIYRGYWGDLALRRVFRCFPTYMIWDDHEIMDGWGSYTKDELSNTLDTLWEWENKAKNLKLADNMFRAAKKVYDEYQHSHNPPTLSNRWDYTFEWPYAAFYVLDMRGRRDFEADSHRILGEPQMRRFKDWLTADKTSQADVVFIVSPVPVVHLTDFVVNTLDLPALGLADDLRDEWDHENNREERNELLDAVFRFSQDSGKRVVFLSGDVHVAAAFKLTRQRMRDARVYQLTSSAITYCKTPGSLLKLVVRQTGELKETTSPTSCLSLHEPFPANNFGLVHIEKRPSGPPKLMWDLYGSTGTEEQLVRLKRLELE